jgi:hypothetical protein
LLIFTTRTLERLEGSMRPSRQGPEEQWLKALLLLMLNPLHNEALTGGTMMTRIVAIIHALPASCHKVRAGSSTCISWCHGDGMGGACWPGPIPKARQPCTGSE